jgi:hypothetical protein
MARSVKVRATKNHAAVRELREKTAEDLATLYETHKFRLKDLATAFEVSPVSVGRVLKEKGISIHNNRKLSNNGKVVIRIGEMRFEVDENIRLSTLRRSLGSIKLIVIEF